MNFFWLPFPTKRSTKTPQTFGKIREKFGAKFGRNPGQKFEKLGELLFGDFSDLIFFTKHPRPLYYKTPPCAFYHKNVRSKAVFGP